MSAQVSLVCVGARDESLSTGRLVLHVTLAGGDPCMDVGGATLRTTEGVISFMGDGYENDALVRLRRLCPHSLNRQGRALTRVLAAAARSASGRSSAGKGIRTSRCCSAASRRRRTSM